MSGGCAALTSASLLSSVLNLSLTRSALAQVGGLGGYKALVCLFLRGGADTFNVLAPCEPSEYADYASVRGNLALAHGDLLPISDSEGRQFGIHPGMTEVRDLYQDGNLAFLANVGSLVAPTDRGTYDARANLPLGLFSHPDQQRHWQTSVPQSRNQITGWAGRMADALTDSANSNPTISMNLALNRVNILQTGDDVIPYVIRTNGASTLSGYGSTNTLDRILTRSTDSLLEQTYADLLEKTHAGIRRNSIDAALAFNAATSAIQLSTVFPATNVGNQLEMVARSIGAHGDLGQTRQIFFVERGGWDHHDEMLNNQANMLPEVSAALRAFYDATVELGVADDVVLFTISDFARTLTSNGNGSDHAWGANHWMMGRGVRGGDVYGAYPTSLALGNPLDLGRGILIPTTSTAAYYAELAQWFGIPNDATMEVVLPNIRNFHPSGSATPPIGFM
jgi:uncharacterized protein (DUF1501 family)